MLAKIKNLRVRGKLLMAILILICIGIISTLIVSWNVSSPGFTRSVEKDGMVQVYIPAGTFEMGSPEEIMLSECQKYRDDCLEGFYQSMEPAHTVKLAAFWIDQTEVTNAMFALCVEDGYCHQPDESLLFSQVGYYEVPEFANYPVREVTWEDALNYCTWAGRRLPTEAEWEKAARGTDGRLYPWGNDPVTGNRNNFCDVNCPRSNRDLGTNDGYIDTSPVGSYPDGASPYGVLDMAGNVREWTSSLYLPYPYRANDGREDLTVDGYRVVRGNHWDGTADFALAAYRFEDPPDYHSTCVGFRCVSSH
jgi:formylglycine-generating enzyme required for sulfatase activity